MQLSLQSLLLPSSLTVLAQSTFEPHDFNVTEALIDQGINVSALPELAALSVRSSITGCSTAVSVSILTHLCHSRTSRGGTKLIYAFGGK